MPSMRTTQKEIADYAASLSPGELDCVNWRHDWPRPEEIERLSAWTIRYTQQCDSCNLIRTTTRTPGEKPKRKYDKSEMETGNYHRTGQGPFTSQQRLAMLVLTASLRQTSGRTGGKKAA